VLAKWSARNGGGDIAYISTQVKLWPHTVGNVVDAADPPVSTQYLCTFADRAAAQAVVSCYFAIPVMKTRVARIHDESPPVFSYGYIS
jgi:hypothetical protein